WLGLCHPSHYSKIAEFLLEDGSPFFEWCGYRKPDVVRQLLANVKLPSEEIDYHDYEVTIFEAAALGLSRALEFASVAEQTFPGLQVSIQKGSGEADCGYSVSGQDDAVRDDPDQWLSLNRGRYC